MTPKNTIDHRKRYTFTISHQQLVNNDLRANFRFVNEEDTPIVLPGIQGHPPSSGKFLAHFLRFEVDTDGKWNPLDVGYCGPIVEYAIAPGQELLLDASLGVLVKAKVPADRQARVILGDFVSKPFYLDGTLLEKH